MSWRWKCQKSWRVTLHDWLFSSSILAPLIGMIYLVTVYWHISLNFSLLFSLSLSTVYLVFCRLLIHFNITSEFTLLTCQRHLTFSKWNISYKTKFSFKLQTHMKSKNKHYLWYRKTSLQCFIVLVVISFNKGSIEQYFVIFT